MTRGRFISLEGGEGVGKSTQLRLLAAVLEEMGLEVVITREPGGSPGGEAIRFMLLHGEDDRWTPRAEALLFAAARADHIEKLIKPALERGAWVISDRFLDSSLAYQGEAGGLGIARVRDLHEFGSEDFLPDRTLVLHLDPSEGVLRAKHRDGDADRIGGRSPAYHGAVANGFKTLSEKEPDRVKLVDASGNANAVTARLFAAIADLMP